jgi:REP element-mobilizing transposase RayT
MARANRHHLPGHVWHITHRCHKKEFLLKFDKDKKCWLHWLFEAKKRYGLVILDFTITSNHIHLLVYDGKANVIPKSIQLVAGRTAREYNRRKSRTGAFWEDRYHATAVQSEKHLIRCLAYIDLNMVRAGVVQSPGEWKFGGYREIQRPKQRYSLLDRHKLTALLGLGDSSQLADYHRRRVKEIFKTGSNQRDARWTESIAVGDKRFVMETKAKLGIKAIGRSELSREGGFELKDPQSNYRLTNNTAEKFRKLENRYHWRISAKKTKFII